MKNEMGFKNYLLMLIATAFVGCNVSIIEPVLDEGNDSTGNINQAPLAPSFDNTSSNFNSPFTLNLYEDGTTDPDFLEFRYTVNDVAPVDCNDGIATSGPINIPAANTEIRAIACDAQGHASNVTEAAYYFDNGPPTVSLNQASGQADPANSTNVEFTIVFNEAINTASFDTSDITNIGTAGGVTWNIVNSGDDTNFTLQATTIISDGTLIPLLLAGSVADDAGNYNTVSTSTDNTVTYDGTSPTITVNQKSGQADPANSTNVEFTVVFSEAIDDSTFTIADITQNGTATGITWNLVNSGDDTTYTLQATAITGDGTLIPSIAINTITDIVGNVNFASTSTDNSITYDGTGPSVTINQKSGQSDPTNSTNVEFTIVFSEAIDDSTFTTSDITQNGTATGITWNLVNSGDDTTYTLQATAITGDGTLIPSIAINTVTDVGGNNNSASTSTDNSVTFDTAAPTVTINQKSGQADPANSTNVEFTIVFNEAINDSTFTTSDITQNGTATGITWNLVNSGDDTTYTLQATVVTGDGTLVPSIAINTVTDVAGNNNSASTSTDNSVTYDTAAPTVTINQKAGQSDPANSTNVEFAIVFNEAIDDSTFTTTDITQNGTATGITWNLVNSGDDTTYTLQATAVTGDGTLIPSLALNTVTDVAGNNNAASTSTDNSVTYDGAGPSVTINQKSGQSDPANSTNVEFTIVFNEAIDDSTFTTADITQNGTASGITWNLVNSGDDITYTLQATAITGDGTLIPSIAINTVTDVGGNNNSASTSTDNSVTYDTAAPTVTINQKSGQSDPANSTNVEFTIVFNEAIDDSTFTTSDITQNGTATGITWNLVNSGDDITYTLQATAITGDGTLVPSLALNTVTDVVGNNNSASTSTDNSVTYDTAAPTVTINQKSGQADPANSTNVEFTIVFSEAIDNSTFTTTDITQNGTATGITWNLVNSGDDTTYTLQATAITGDGTLIPSIAINTVTDVAGNNNAASTSTDNSVTYDGAGPSVTINQKAGQNDPANSTNVEFTIVFNEAIDDSTFTTADITQNGTASGITWNLVNSGDDITYTLQATAITGDGTLIPSIAINRVTDVGGNNNAASTSTDNSVTYDTAAPTVTINQKAGQSDPANSTNVEFTIVFNEAIDDSTFTTTDITQSGTATGITWNLVNSGDDITYTLQATAVTGDGTIIPSLALNTVTDVVGNNNSASTSTDNSVTYDTAAPSVTINQKAGQSDPANSTNVEFTIVFSEAIDNTVFTIADITQNGTASGITWNLVNSGDDTTYTLQATAVTGDGTLIPSIAINRVTDVAGNNNVASTSTDNSVTYDGAGPSVTINQKSGQSDPANSTNVEFTIVFNEAIDDSTFTTADITQNGTASGITWNLVNSGDDTTYTLQATAVTGDGTLIPSIAINTVTDVGGNNNSASTSTDNSVTYDTTAPTVTINQKAGQSDPANSTNVEFTIVFNEAIDDSTFTNTDITQNGTATGITWNLVNSGDDTTYTLQATVVTGDGTLIPSIAINTVTDVAGNNNSASTSTDNSVTYDTAAPTVTINQKAGQSDPANSTNVEFTVVFNEAIDDTVFTIADITQNGTATGITWNLVNSGDDTTYTLQATAVTGGGTLIPSIAINRVTDVAGNNNVASTSTDNSVTYDGAGPSVTINQKAGQSDPANSTNVEFTIVFSEAINDSTFTTADITQNGTASGITWNLVNSGDDTTYTLQATAVTGDGTLIPSIAINTVTDVGGNNNSASTSTDNSVTYDTTAPTVTINQKAGQSDPANSTNVEFTIVFNEAIDDSTFTTTDITQNGTATGISWNLVNSGNNTTYTLQANAVTGDGTIIPSLAINKVTDVAGNNNMASTSTDNSVTYDGSAPTVTINQKAGQNDPANSTNVEFTIVFNEAIDDSTFTTSDITQSGTATGITWNLVNSGDDTTYTLQATAVTGDGTLIPSIAINRVTDVAGNNNVASTSTDNSVTYDGTGPSVTINQKSGQSDPTSSAIIEFDVVFSEPIDTATFIAADITQNGTATGITWEITNSGDDTNFTLKTTETGSGTIIPSIAINKVTDVPGNNNSASTATDNSVTKESPDQVDDDNTSLGFGGATHNGTTYSGSVLTLNATTNNSELDEPWTPKWSSVVGYWKMNGTLGNITDGSTITATVGADGVTTDGSDSSMDYVAGKSNQGVIFDGVDDYITSNSDLTATSYPVTLAAWVKKGTSASDTAIVSIADGTVSNQYISIGVNSSGNPDLSIWTDASADSLTSSYKIDDDNWHYVVGVFKNATSREIYVDGVYAGIDTTSNLYPTNVSRAVIGTLADSTTPTTKFEGSIDEVTVWTAALTQEDIALIYNRQSAKFSGEMKSRIIDSGTSNSSWTDLNWVTTLPFMKELTGDSGSETSTNYSSISSDTLMTDLVALWHLNETSWTDDVESITDSSTNSQDLTPKNGAVSTSHGKFKRGAYFDGTNDYIRSVGSGHLSQSTTMTTSAWVNISSISTTDWIYGKSYGFRIGVNSNHRISLWIRGDNISSSDVTSQINTGDNVVNLHQWHHIVAKFDAAASPRFKIYIDGVLEGSGSTPIVQMKYLSNHHYILGDGFEGYGQYFNGYIDEVAVWSRALDDNEILELYRRGANRIKYQVRTCANSDCSDQDALTGDGWKGPGGNYYTYFNELYNNDLISSSCATAQECYSSEISLDGNVNTASPSIPFSDFGTDGIDADDNRYFQYRAIMESDDINTLCNSGTQTCMPELDSVTIAPAH